MRSARPSFSLSLAPLRRWTLPSCIPVGAFGPGPEGANSSLFIKFNESIVENLGKFPTGPGLADPFWIYLITWHLGLFIALTLAKIGIEGRKEGYFGEAPPRDQRNPMR